MVPGCQITVREQEGDPWVERGAKTLTHVLPLRVKLRLLAKANAH